MGNVVVFGAGQMGFATSLGMKRLGHSVLTVDINSHNFSELKRNGINTKCVMNTRAEATSLVSSADVVISCLPYHKNLEVAKSCIESSVPYCDLGGRVDISDKIHSICIENSFSQVFTDLGLAPGLVNIIAEYGCSKMDQPTDVKMMVGGLPNKVVDNPLGYLSTWSTDGLINEYRDDCVVLKNGKIIKVKALEGLELVKTKKSLVHRELEAFYTSGGSSHSIHTMKRLGVSNCSYKTLRFKGHKKLVDFLINKCELDDETLKKIFEEGCSLEKCNNSFSSPWRVSDIVILLCSVTNGDGLCWEKEIIIDSKDGLSAMQRSTAFSICSVADLLIRGLVSSKSEYLQYSDIPFGEFSSNMKKFDIEI